MNEDDERTMLPPIQPRHSITANLPVPPLTASFTSNRHSIPTGHIIEDGTPAAEALKANATVKVTKLDKFARKVGAPAAKKFVKRAATLKGPGYTKRGKPPRVPSHYLKEEGGAGEVEMKEMVGEDGRGGEDASKKVTINEEVNDEKLKTEEEATLPTPPPSPSASKQHRKKAPIDPHAPFPERRWRRGHRSDSINRPKKAKKSRTYVKGKVIDGQHELYTLSIAVMLGLRTSIGMTNGQLNRSMNDSAKKDKDDEEKQCLTCDDFMAVEKYVFRPKGGINTPPHDLAHTFKFKDYSPKAFAYLRRLFGVNEYDFLSSVCGNANFTEFISNAKSGQFFFYSSDGKFMIKTMTNAESKFLRRILPHYFKHCCLNPNTFVARFLGMYRVKLYHLKRNVKFIIMNSVFDTDKGLQSFFDLKGSVIGREAKPGEDVKKDNDVRRTYPESAFALPPSIRSNMRKQLENDCNFFKSMKIMDYSMLIGVHHVPTKKNKNCKGSDRSSLDSGAAATNNTSLKKPNSIRELLRERTQSSPLPPIIDHLHRATAMPENIILNSLERLKPKIDHPSSAGPMAGASQYFQHKDSLGSIESANLRDHNPLYDSSTSNASISAFENYFDEDDEHSYLDGATNHPQHDTSHPHEEMNEWEVVPESTNLNTSIELKKEFATEQMYWPFQRLYDIQGRRRTSPMNVPNASAPEDKDEDIDNTHHHDNRTEQNESISSNPNPNINTILPVFQKPISNRKDGGLIMDTTHFPIPIDFRGSGNKIQYCDGKIFYMGIIDILQQFNIRKRIEARWLQFEGKFTKGRGWEDASCVHPSLYADRFLKFFDEYAMRGEGVEVILKEKGSDDEDEENVEQVVFYMEGGEEEKLEIAP